LVGAEAPGQEVKHIAPEESEMSGNEYSPVIRSLHRISQGAYEQALDELASVWIRALQAGEKSWAAMILWHCMIIAENMGDWHRAAEYGERVLLLQDDAYLRLFLFRAYRRLENEKKAAEHLRASVDLADETRDQSFLETLVTSVTREEPAVIRALRPEVAPRPARRWQPASQRRRTGRAPATIVRHIRARDV
jgi:hypothetical protein